MLANVEMAVDVLRREHGHVTQRAVAKKLGLSVAGLVYYPRVREFLRFAAASPLRGMDRALREIRLVGKVQEAWRVWRRVAREFTRRDSPKGGHVICWTEKVSSS